LLFDAPLVLFKNEKAEVPLTEIEPKVAFKAVKDALFVVELKMASTETLGAPLGFQLPTVVSAPFEPPVHILWVFVCAFKLPTPPTTTANNPTHFPSLKTGPAIFQTGRRVRRFGILDVGCWMLDVE
jgi:hypothetical protein